MDDVGETSGCGDLYWEVGKMMPSGCLGELVRVREVVSMKDCKVIRGVGLSTTDSMQYLGECTRGVMWVNKNRKDSLNN